VNLLGKKAPRAEKEPGKYWPGGKKRKKKVNYPSRSTLQGFFRYPLILL